MASRRLKSDRFFTTDFTPEVYTQTGIDWVNKTKMKDVHPAPLPRARAGARGHAERLPALEPGRRREAERARFGKRVEGVQEGRRGDQRVSALPEASLGESAARASFVRAAAARSSRGLFSPRPAAQKLLTALDADARDGGDAEPTSARKHPGAGRAAARRAASWCCGAPDAIREVLDQSADVYDVGLGRQGQGHGALPARRADAVARRGVARPARVQRVGAGHVGARCIPTASASSSVVADEVERLRLGEHARAGRTSSGCSTASRCA